MSEPTWRHIYIADHREAFSTSGAIHKQILAAMLSGATSAAVFSRLDRERGGTHFYFNAAASTVAAMHGATPCPAPTLEQAGGLLIGEASAKDELAK